MSESDTIFNERDRRCAAVQLMPSTDPSYDNKTIPAPSKCKSGRFNVPRVMKSFRLLLWSLVWFQVRATSCHLTSSKSTLESQHQSVPGCAKKCGYPRVQSGGRWQTLSVAAGLSAVQQVQRDPGMASEGVLQLCTLLSLATLLSWPEPAGLLRLVIRREHQPTWPPTTPKPAWSLPFAEYSLSSRWHLWKRHASSSGSLSRRWLRLKAATLNRRQL